MYESLHANDACSVVLVTLYADSLHVVIPAFSSTTYKIMGIFM